MVSYSVYQFTLWYWALPKEFQPKFTPQPFLYSEQLLCSSLYYLSLQVLLLLSCVTKHVKALILAPVVQYVVDFVPFLVVFAASLVVSLCLQQPHFSSSTRQIRIRRACCLHGICNHHWHTGSCCRCHLLLCSGWLSFKKGLLRSRQIKVQ